MAVLSDPISDFLTRLKNASRILVAAHLRPDGDAVGSVSGLVKSLQRAGKNVEAGLLDADAEADTASALTRSDNP